MSNNENIPKEYQYYRYQDTSDPTDGDFDFDNAQQVKAEECYIEGLKLFKQGKTQEAEKLYKQALDHGKHLSWDETELPPYEMVSEKYKKSKMTESNSKHTSKYKNPKDQAKSQKPESRKDIKDYTKDDKLGNMVPDSVKEKQKNVLRKTDKEVIDTGDMVVDLKDKDRVLKLDGEHDPKHSAKLRAKKQDEDEKESKDEIMDKIENLTREQKEAMLKNYIRKNVKGFIAELALGEQNQEDDEDPAVSQLPDETADVAPEEAGATDPGTPKADTLPDETSQADMPIDPNEQPSAEEEVPANEPAPEEAPEEEPEMKNDVRINHFIKALELAPTSKHKVALIIMTLDKYLANASPDTVNEMYNLLKLAATKKMNNVE